MTQKNILSGEELSILCEQIALILRGGLPMHDGLAHFSKVNPSKLKYLYKYAGDMELTFGEFMFDFMLDMENDSEKLTSFFK